MDQWSRMTSFTTETTERAAGVYRTVNRQPSWIVRAALTVFLLVICLPVILLITVAFLLALLVFGVLSLINAAANRFRSPRSAHDGRSNVRVIDRS